jgi:hemolysin activation/secretion protein
MSKHSFFVLFTKQVMMMQRDKIRATQKMLVTAVCLLLAGSTAAAAELPTAGTLSRAEQDKEEVGLPEAAGTAAIEVSEPERPPLSMAEDVKINVTGFAVTGQDIVDETILQEQLKEYQGRMVSFKELQAGAEKLTAYFRQRGYLMAHVYLPAQKIKNGVVEYRVLIGRIDEIKLDNKTSIHESVLQREIRFLHPGDYITRAKLERAVWLLSDLAGADAKASMETGRQEGTVILKLTLMPHYGKCGMISADNYGNRYTGYNSYGVFYNILNPEQAGGQLDLAGRMTGSNLYNYSLRYLLPFGADGLRATLGYSMLSYQLGDTYRVLDACGTSRTASIGLEYALRRSQYENLYAGLSYEKSMLSDEYRTVDYQLKKHTHALVLSLYGDKRWSRAQSSWRMDYKWGTLGADNDEAYVQQQKARTAGTYHKLRGSWQYMEQLSPRVSWQLYARGQLASRNLDSSERFSLGGATGVRAYPASESSGDMGYLIRGELRYLLPFSGKIRCQLAGFIDHGGVVIAHDHRTSGENHRFLQGAGVGLLLNFADAAFLRADYAWPLGAQEAQNDKNKTHGCFWLRGGIYF